MAPLSTSRSKRQRAEIARPLVIWLFKCWLFHFLVIQAASVPVMAATEKDDNNNKDIMVFDVLVYGSTPSGIMAAVAASRHLHNTTNHTATRLRVALLSQRSHIGGVCAGGLGETDVGDCADQVLGGLALEFFHRNLQQYPHTNRTDPNPNPNPNAHVKPWNLEPHVAERVFREMLDEAGVVLLPYGQVVAVTMKKGGYEKQHVHGDSKTADNNNNIIEKIHVGYTHRYDTTYTAHVFIDASYEGDLMARVPGLTYTVGRESQQQYNESGAGSGGPGRRIAYGMEYMNPFWDDGDENKGNRQEGLGRSSSDQTLRRNTIEGNDKERAALQQEQSQQPAPSKRRLLPLLQPSMPKPQGEADKNVQAYNFRICVTNDTSLRVPFTEPDSYASHGGTRWELLRRFWRGWCNSTNPFKHAQAAVPSAIMGRIPSSYDYFGRNGNIDDNTTKIQGMKFDMNNCGYNPIHTDWMGHSAEYPEADYDRRDEIWQDHVTYTKEYLWFMSSDPSVPDHVRHAFRDDWGYCGDEFPDTDHFPPQLYVREARRLVGQQVLTQNIVLNKTSLGKESIGMGCYTFDSHCVARYACTDPNLGCRLYNTPFVATEAGTGILASPGTYEIPWSVLLPQKSQVTNLLVSVCVSASHVAYSTVRMEPQYMIMGHAAGVVAALALRDSKASPVVQDIDLDRLRQLLVQDGQIVSLNGTDPGVAVSKKNLSQSCTSDDTCITGKCFMALGTGYSIGTCIADTLTSSAQI